MSPSAGAPDQSATSGGPSSKAPSRSQRRIQAVIDTGVAVIIAMLAYPFPIARAMLPVPVYIASVLVLWQVVQVGYCAIAAAAWGTTAGMYLLGLSLDAAEASEPTRGARAVWGALAGLAATLHVVIPPRGRALAERASHLELRTE